jgi:protein-tyrosine phosphatase
MEKYKVLFVCLGNICRSPAAEGIMKAIAEKQGWGDKLEIDSAGTAGYHTGELPDARMRRHGARRGYTFDSLSRKFSPRDFERFDIILAMDDNNYYDIRYLSPDAESESKVRRMVEFSERFQHGHVPDPYYMGADGFELVLDLLEDACQGLFCYIKENKEKK